MKNKILVLIIIILLIIFVFIRWEKLKDNFTFDLNNSNLKNKEPISLCYAFNSNKENASIDRAFLKLDINGENVSGIYNFLPAEKDTKVGNFEGTVGKLNQESMAREAVVFWNSFAEGIHAKEELRINFGDGSASILAGDMEDRGDGVYVYKKDAKLVPSLNLSQIDCSKYITALFICPSEDFIDAQFLNSELGNTVYLTLKDGRGMQLFQGISASGARYTNRSESFVFWNKGDTAFIEDNGKIILNNCVVKSDTKEQNKTETGVETKNNNIVGGDKDIHGCIGSAGYSWCEEKSKCLRIWEEKCEKADSTKIVLNQNNKKSSCEKNGGIYFEESKICEINSLNENECRAKGGEFNPCASACRHDPKAEMCTMQCVLTCSFK